MVRSPPTSAACVALLIAGCGGGGSTPTINNPPQMATLSGSAYGSGPFGNGTVVAYSFTGGRRGSQLAATTLNANGQYTLSVPANTPAVIEVTAGCYTEHASLKNSRLPVEASVCMSAGETLRATIVPALGINRLNVTPYTEAATGLASYLSTHGMSDTSAITTANQHFNSIVGTNITSTIPVVIDGNATLDDGHVYGALLSGIASWVASLTSPGAGAVFGTSPYTTLTVARLMSDDLSMDGILDGNASQTPLRLGSTALNTTIYRHQFAAFSAMHVRYNALPSIVPSYSLPIKQYNDSNDSIFGNSMVVDLDEGGATISNSTLPETFSASGSMAIRFYVDDIVGIASNQIELLVDDIFYDAMLFDGQFLGQTSSLVNTTIFPNGNHKVTVRVTNFLGSVTEQSAIINFQN